MRIFAAAVACALVLGIAAAAPGAPGDTKKDGARRLVRTCGATPYTQREIIAAGQERLAEFGIPVLHIRTTLGPATLTLYGESPTIDYEALVFRSGRHTPSMTVAELRSVGDALWRCDPVLARDLAGAKTVPGGFLGVFYLRGKRFGYVYNTAFAMAEVGSLAWFEFIRRTGE